MKLRRIVYSIICMLMTLLIIPFGKVNAAQSKSENRTLGEIQDEIEKYLESTHPNIKVGTQVYLEYLSEQLMTEEDTKLASRNDYEDICTYAAKYISLVEDKQCIYTNPEQILNLSESERAITLQTIERESAVEEKQDQQLAQRSVQSSVQSSKNYSSSKAVSYARKWATKRNSAYASYPSDCTNFVSQAVYAGGISMRKPRTIKHGVTQTTSYWYSKKHKFTGTTGRVSYEYDVSTSWMRVSDLYKYAISHGAKAISCSTLSSLQNKAKPGDIVQLKKNGSWHHSIIITGGSKGNRTYCGHSRNRKDQPVKGLNKESAYRIIRFN